MELKNRFRQQFLSEPTAIGKPVGTKGTPGDQDLALPFCHAFLDKFSQGSDRGEKLGRYLRQHVYALIHLDLGHG